MSHNKREQYWLCSRGFYEDVPVHVYTRFVLREDLCAHPAFRMLVVALILRAARRCKVKVLAIAVLHDHIHVLVSEGVIPWSKQRHEGIWPFMQRWKAAVSRHLRKLEITGCKFEGRYKSTVCETRDAYVAKYAYVVEQARRHGARPEEIYVNDGILRGEADGVAHGYPDLCPEVSPEEYAAWFGQLLKDVGDAAFELAEADLEAERAAAEKAEAEARRKAGKPPVDPERKARRKRLESRRARQAAIRARLHSSHWDRAARSELEKRKARPSAAASEVELVGPEALLPGHGALAKALEGYALPTDLEVEHELDDHRRAVRTHIRGGGAEVTMRWSIRVSPPPAT